MADKQDETSSTAQVSTVITIDIPTLTKVYSNVFKMQSPNEYFKVITTFPSRTLYRNNLLLPDQCVSTIFQHPLSRVKYYFYFDSDPDNYSTIDVGKALYDFASNFVTLVNRRMLNLQKFMCKITMTVSPVEDIMVSVVYEPNVQNISVE